MNALVQNFSDLKLILSTDKRFWAAGAFIGVALFVWFSTTTWREEAAPNPERYKFIKVEEPEINVMVKDFNSALKEAKEERALLKDSILRMDSDLQTNKQDVNWHMSTLVEKLDDITEHLDLLANRVGSSAVNAAKTEERLKLKEKRDTRKHKVAVNVSDIR